MTYNQMLFLTELLTSNVEKSFIADLRVNPDDQATINAYVDWLTDNGREGTARLVKGGFIPSVRDAKPVDVIFSGHIASGSIGKIHIASGGIASGYFSVGAPEEYLPGNGR